MEKTLKPVPAGKWPILFFLLFCAGSRAFAQFAAGNLVVLQAGDGTSALVNTGNRIVLREFNPLGVSAFSVAVPTSVDPLLISGSASSEGALSLSANGEYLVFGGYARPLPNTTPLPGSSASAINRAVGLVSAAGGYTRVATSSTFFSGNNIRSAASDGNNNYWAAGSNNGTPYFGLMAPPLSVQNAATNTRYTSVVNGNLYVSCGSGAYGVYRIGTGLPFSAGQTASLVINTANTGAGSPSPYAFYFNPALTVCYVADDRNPANGGGLQKWVYSAGTWSLAYTLGTGVNYGARGVVADFSGPDPIVYAITSEGSLNKLIAVNDAGALSTATTLAASGSNAIFRGLAFSPFCSDPQIGALGSSSPACAMQSLTLNAAIAGPGPLTYSWSGPGGYSSPLQSPVLANPASGVYSLTIANGCGSDTASTAITINPLPQLAVNEPTICNGGTATLIASGAATYTWSDGSTTPAMTVSPAASMGFTVSAASAQGCVSTAVTSVQVVSALALSAGSATVCEGTAALLTVSGAGSYTWSPGDLTPSISVSPAVTTVYTVIGSASGCASTASTTVMVTVHALPSVSVSSAVVCANSPATLSALGASAYSWDTGAAVPEITVTPAVSTAYTVTGISAQGCSDTAVASVTVLPLPVVSLMVADSIVCLSSPVMELNGLPAGGGYAGPGISGNLFDPFVSQAGTFTVSYSYTDNNNCSGLANKTIRVDACTAAPETRPQEWIKIWPNPMRDHLQIDPGVFAGAYAVDLYDAQGKNVFSHPSLQGSAVLETGSFSRGFYFLRIRRGSFDHYLKVIKE